MPGAVSTVMRTSLLLEPGVVAPSIYPVRLARGECLSASGFSRIAGRAIPAKTAVTTARPWTVIVGMVSDLFTTGSCGVVVASSLQRRT